MVRDGGINPINGRILTPKVRALFGALVAISGSITQIRRLCPNEVSMDHKRSFSWSSHLKERVKRTAASRITMIAIKVFFR